MLTITIITNKITDIDNEILAEDFILILRPSLLKCDDDGATG